MVSKSLTVRLSLSGTHLASRAARNRLRQALIVDWCLPEAESEDLISAVGEAVTNAYRHGCRERPGPIIVLARLDPPTRTVAVMVSDPGPGFDPTKPFRTEYIDGQWLQASGRLIMSKCTDSVCYYKTPPWFTCKMTKRFC